MKKLTLKDVDLKNKKVLMRVDYNVPLDKDGKISDDTRIKASLPSLQYILDKGGSVILMSHLGRPKGVRDPKYSLKPCAKRLSELLHKSVTMAPDCIGSDVKTLVKNLQSGEILLLENLRFYPAEEKPETDPSFAKQLAELGDIYVNDAFGTAHRAHSSTVTVARYFPDRAVAGFLMEKEMKVLGQLIENPQRPFYAIIGGAKISSKLGVIQSLLQKVDRLLIGGGMAFTFFKAQGISIGDSIHEDECLEQAQEILDGNEKSKLLLPVDLVIADRLEDSAKTAIVTTKEGVPNGYQGVDIGPKTIELFKNELQKASTIFWNGPLGVFEVKRFAEGTNAIAHALAESNAVTIIGGGESVAAVQAAGVADKMTHISTGGGASLEYLEYGSLPGIEALTDKKS